MKKIPNLRIEWRSEAQFIMTGVLQSRDNSVSNWQRQVQGERKSLITEEYTLSHEAVPIKELCLQLFSFPFRLFRTWTIISVELQ